MSFGVYVYRAVFVAALGTVVSLVNHKQRAHGPHRWPYEFKSYGDASLPTVVLVPGLDGCTSFFADVVPELTVNFHVIMFYLPLAPGPFDEPLPEGETYSFEFLARRLKNVLIKTGKLQNVHLVGESFGGVVAQHFALMEPDTLASLTIISSLCRTELTPTVALKAQYVLPAVETLGHAFPGFAQQLFAFFHVSDVVEAFEPQWMKDFFVKEASWAHHYSVIERIKIVIRLNMCEESKKIDTPTLIVYGREDNFTKAGSLELFKQIPRGDLLEIPGGHLPHVTNPKPFSKQLTSFIMQETSKAAAFKDGSVKAKTKTGKGKKSG